jgi:RimJ/RimL family protein N-acetyltransferase
MDPVTLTTSRLVMRPWRDADRDPFFAINSEPAVLRYLNPISREGSDGMIDRITAHFAEHGWGLWALEDRASSTLIGLCGLLTVDGTMPFAPAVEIGWRLSGPWQGKGLAREAAEAALAFGFDTLRLERIVSFTVPANTASWGLMERLGMTRVGAFDHPRLPEGHRLRSHLLYEKRH